MPRTVYYTATTLDGFIATPDHSLDWLLSRGNDPAGPMGYDTFIPDIGALAMGAATYRWLLDNHPEMDWPYSVPAWVFTHGHFPARTDGADVRFTQDPIPLVHKEMRDAAGERNIWIVGGGPLAAQFAEHDLLDEVCVSIAPLTLGAGRPLLPHHVELTLTELARNGEFACARYDVVRTSSR
ncbi:dihydrofolate reductase family protein [Nocardia nova]|uniref:dihydrofolate reductase family protein n=1 Tax=Nocardia nova TaxID=37330 RepID=UPI0033EB5F86